MIYPQVKHGQHVKHRQHDGESPAPLQYKRTSGISAPVKESFDAWLNVAYQPIFDTISGTAVGIQALARRNVPGLKSSGANTFPSVAEQAGQIDDIVAFTERVLWECPAWEFGGCLFLSISGRDFMSPRTIESLFRVIARADVPAEHIVFEITEPYPRSIKYARKNIGYFRSIGVRFALYFSEISKYLLDDLSNIPIDVLKVDASLIANLADDVRRRSLVSSILKLSQRLNLDCILEGITAPAQALQASLIGGRFMQGHHFIRPCSSKEALAQLPKAFRAR